MTANCPYLDNRPCFYDGSGLRANENFLALQQELSDLEEKVAFARQFYNRNVMDFNTRIQVFPNVIFANMFNFERFEFFEAEEPAREDVQVTFST